MTHVEVQETSYVVSPGWFFTYLQSVVDTAETEVYLYSNVRFALLSVTAPLFRVIHSLLFSSALISSKWLSSSSQTKWASIPFAPAPYVPFPLPHPAPASFALSTPSLNVRFPLPSPRLLYSSPILPLVSLMNGFTAGKVLIFIPLSDFCWLLLISNTQRKASESINKEMNTLHPAMQQLSHSFTQDAALQSLGLHLSR